MVTTRMSQFVVCVAAGAEDADLEIWKIYEAIPDAAADAEGLLRVIDESGEDYLYPAEYFRLIDLPQELRSLFVRAS